MANAKPETSWYFEELLAEYEAKMATVLELEMDERGEEVYYRASALVELVQGYEGEIDAERASSLEEDLAEFEDRYLEPDSDGAENSLELSFEGGGDPPSAV